MNEDSKSAAAKPCTQAERDAREWMRAWRSAGPQLEKIRAQEIQNIDTIQALTQLESAFQSALRLAPVLSTSGLIEQQKWFARHRFR